MLWREAFVVSSAREGKVIRGPIGQQLTPKGCVGLLPGHTKSVAFPSPTQQHTECPMYAWALFTCYEVSGYKSSVLCRGAGTGWIKPRTVPPPASVWSGYEQQQSYHHLSLACDKVVGSWYLKGCFSRKTQHYSLWKHADELQKLWQMDNGDDVASAHAPAHSAVLCDSFTVHSDNVCILEDV